uniref:Splicing factor U2af large subunit B isoform X5 n=1 Tax=Rhizophora mucronata TaxID=61149 RepID=A0A2P2QRX9_RHIMU
MPTRLLTSLSVSRRVYFCMSSSRLYSRGVCCNLCQQKLYA